MTASTDTGEDSGDSLSQALGFSEPIVEVGMTHPALRRVLAGTGGTLSLILTLDDTRVRDLDIEVGLGHRGFEKEVETRSWEAALPYVNRLGYAGAVQYELAYCSAIEALMGTALPEFAIWQRTWAAEVARIADHFTRLACVSAAIGLSAAEATAQNGARAASEALSAILWDGGRGSALMGRGFAATRDSASTATDRRARAKTAWETLQSEIELQCDQFKRRGLQNPGLDRRLRDVGRLSLEECHQWSVTGSALRAAGGEADLRKDAVYWGYGFVDFDVPIAESGDALDRVAVVAEEIRQSLRIARQCFDRWIELGSASVSERRESENLVVPIGEVYHSIEASTGALGFRIVSDGTESPCRVRCRAPSFFHAQALQSVLVGAYLDDVLPAVASMHIVSPECDR